MHEKNVFDVEFPQGNARKPRCIVGMQEDLQHVPLIDDGGLGSLDDRSINALVLFDHLINSTILTSNVPSKQ